MHSLIEDLSLLTTIPINSLNKLVNKSLWCICDCIDEATLSNQNIIDIDIGIGTISILLENDSVQYRFVPSKKLETSVKSTIVDGKNPLIEIAEDKLTKGMLEIHKSFI